MQEHPEIEALERVAIALDFNVEDLEDFEQSLRTREVLRDCLERIKAEVVRLRCEVEGAS